eukprot:TRINITY_DN2881_c0_g1_i1.p1 TRINITY_DN2881_c0_g1~~TRINITY_DN2881_c0_g1_i1.p1  ORF type:complete len:188 (+),score=117.23 TRINITY_DN2881_c0_g1_i1:76-639(+)
MVAELKEITDTSGVDWNTKVVVETRDKKKFEIDRECVKMVHLFTEFLEDAEEGTQIELPLQEVDSEAFRCVYAYLDMYRNKEPEKLEKPLKDDLKNLVSPEDWAYVTQTLLEDGDEKKHDKLFWTLKAINFMQIEPLRDLCCAAIANMLRGKGEKEIMELFNLNEPFTPEEEEKLYQEYEWLRERKD